MPRPEISRPVLRTLASVVLVALAALPCARAASEDDVRTVGEQLVCYCGCSGQTVAACTCGTADQIRDRIRSQLDSGLTPTQVVDAWVAERGEQILAVPTREGFNLVGWVMPFVVTLAALLVLTLLLWRRQRRPEVPVPASPAAAAPEESRYLEQVERGVREISR